MKIKKFLITLIYICAILLGLYTILYLNDIKQGVTFLVCVVLLGVLNIIKPYRDNY